MIYTNLVNKLASKQNEEDNRLNYQAYQKTSPFADPTGNYQQSDILQDPSDPYSGTGWQTPSTQLGSAHDFGPNSAVAKYWENQNKPHETMQQKLARAYNENPFHSPGDAQAAVTRVVHDFAAENNIDPRREDAWYQANLQKGREYAQSFLADPKVLASGLKGDDNGNFYDVVNKKWIMAPPNPILASLGIQGQPQEAPLPDPGSPGTNFLRPPMPDASINTTNRPNLDDPRVQAALSTTKDGATAVRAYQKKIADDSKFSLGRDRIDQRERLAGQRSAYISNKSSGETKFVRLKDGEALPEGWEVYNPSIGTAVAKEVRMLSDAQDMFKNFRDKYDALTAANETGPIAGRWANIASAITSGKAYPEVGAYNDLREGLAARLKSFTGDVGVMTDKDYDRIIKLISGAEADPVKAKLNFDEADEILNSALAKRRGNKTSSSELKNKASSDVRAGMKLQRNSKTGETRLVPK